MCSAVDVECCLQQAQPADGMHQVGLQASNHQPDPLQQQVKQSQAAKQDTEQLYGAFLCAARNEIAAETEYDSYSASVILLKLAWACQTDMRNLPCLQPLLQPWLVLVQCIGSYSHSGAQRCECLMYCVNISIQCCLRVIMLVSCQVEYMMLVWSSHLSAQSWMTI